MSDEVGVVSEESPVPTTLTGPRASLPNTQKSSSYPTSRLSAKVDPVDQTEMIRDSDRMLGSVAGGKLKLIYEQIEFLKDQARDIILEAERDMTLHRATCSFEKRTGHTYHLYERQEGNLYFSLLSPEEWGGNPPHRFVGSFRLESDMSWTEVDEASSS